MVVILFGAPGVGKGTLAQKMQLEGIAKQVSTGDLLRNEIAAGTEIGRTVKQIMDAGKLVADEVVLKLVQGEIEKENVILDGYPRTLKQVSDLDELLKKNGKKIDAVLNVVADEEIVVDRIVNRLICSNCHAIYNKKYSPPKVAHTCDKCGGKIVHRSDDSQEVTMQRIQEYKEKTRPLLEVYGKRGLVIDINSSDEGAVEKIKKILAQ